MQPNRVSHLDWTLSVIFRCVVLPRCVLSGHYFLLCETHPARDGLYPGTDLRGEFIGCVFGELQSGAPGCADDGDAEVGDAKAMRDAGDRHTAFISLARVRYSIGVAGVAAPFIIWLCTGYGDLFELRLKEGEMYFCPVWGAEEEKVNIAKHIGAWKRRF